MTLFTLLTVLLVVLGLAFFRASRWGWLLAAVVLVFFVASGNRISPEALQAVYILLAALIAVFGIPALRRPAISAFALKSFRKVLPQISQTEQEALDAGTVWWEGELFGGHPDWEKLLNYPKATLTEAELAFLQNETAQLCAMLDDWEITHRRADLSPETWQFIKDKGFFGMIIPKEYGGLGFSAQAHSAVVAKIASRSTTAAVTAMVPNSLGPAELLLHYGTEQQKERYLKRLAKGEEVPCFALTGPFAGSDAGAIPDYGIVCRGAFNGEQNVLGVRLTWEKRYITLAPVATLLGLAFKLYDPEGLLGGEKERGITLALIPADMPGVEIGRRHFPLNSAFLNGPTSGRDVFVPLDCIIGGPERIGQGWRMLMECLAAGRSISLPSSAVGGAKLAARTSGAYCRVRRQFKLPIGKFEGVEEALARIGGHTYLMEAARRLTAQAVAQGEKPSVVSAIVKYHCTERGRMVINDAMDVHGGKGICLGPRNYLGRAYQQSPIGITVEGANILTRNMIIFGQGAVRAHPYVLKEIAAAHEADAAKALTDFDDALFGHIGFTVANAARSLVYGLSNGYGIPVHGSEAAKRYYQQLTRFSAAFALLADMSMLVFGGGLKRRERISARLGDALSQLYLCSAVLKRFEDDGHPAEDLPLLQWALEDGLFRLQNALDGVLHNYPVRPLSWLLRGLIFPYGRRLAPPSDRLDHAVATLLMQPGPARDRLTEGMYVPDGDENDPVAVLEAALASALQCESLWQKVEAADKRGLLKALETSARIREAGEQGLLTDEEIGLLERDYALQRKAVMVDDFAAAELPAGRS
ncbi:MAG: acyl-CoA dehydrogenase [Pseudomonadota bacterium]